MSLILFPHLHDTLNDLYSFLPNLNLLIGPREDFAWVLILIPILGILFFRARYQSEKTISNKFIYVYTLNLIIIVGYLATGNNFYVLWSNYLNSNGAYEQIVFFSLLLTISLLSIRYWGYSKTMITILDNLDKETQNKVSEIRKNIKSREKDIDELTSNIVEDVRVRLEQDNDLKKLDDYDTKVPRYFSQRPFRKVGERHDEYELTKDLKDLTKYVTEMDKGSFGIAGVRGFGKTALMRALEKKMEGGNSNKYVTVWLSAPTAISEETFLLSVLAKLATRVGTKLTKNLFWPDENPDILIQQKKRNQIIKSMSCILLVLGVCAVGI